MRSTALILLLAALLPAVARAQRGGGSGPQIAVTPSSQTFSGSGATYTVAVVVQFCDNTSDFDYGTLSFTLDGVDVASAFSIGGTWQGTPCAYQRRYMGNVVLPQTMDGVHDFEANIEDLNGWYGGGSAIYTYRWPGYVAPRYAVRVLADVPTAQVPHNTTFTTHFTVLNLGTRHATYTLTASCPNLAYACSASPASVSLDSLGSGQSATVTVTDSTKAANDTAQVQLKATYSTDKDSAMTDILVPGATAARSVGAVFTDSTTEVRRGDCLTIALGAAAASSCGDLRLAHALPAVTTRGTTRTPVLVYNSAHALGLAFVGLEVTPAARAAALDSVVATAKIGGVTHGRGKWSGSDWAQGGSATTRHLAVRLDTLLTTGPAPDVAMTVQAYYHDADVETYTPTQPVAIVNRSSSPFGAGWWFGGLEQIAQQDDTNWLWTGGDGSTRLYYHVDGTHWAAHHADRPDTLVLSGGLYYRQLANGAKVAFAVTDSTGYVSMTVPLVGPTTRFTYDGSHRISRIVIPTIDTSTKVHYDFTYTSDTLVKITLTAPNYTRVTKLHLTAGKLMRITDPDTAQVSFGYLSSSKRITSRVDPLGDTTQFVYDTVAHVLSSSLQTASWTMVTTVDPAESRGALHANHATAQPVDSVYTLLDGPRTDVTDVTRVWLNPYGAPRHMVDASARDTWITFDPTWPVLASTVTTPGGAMTRAWYNARGLPDSTKAYNVRYIGDVAAATRYTWDSTLTVPTLVQSPAGDSTQYSYNRNGTLQWAQVGSSSSTRYTFDYYTVDSLPGVGLYRASAVPGYSQRDSVLYDTSLGNPSSMKGRDGHWRYTARDGLGRVRYARTQYKAGFYRRDSTEYDLASRVIRTVSWSDTTHYVIGDASGPVGADTLYVTNTYDHAGQLLSTARWVRPDSAHVDTITDHFLYDAAGRKTSEWNTAGVDNTYTYDLAGNLTEQFSLLTQVNYAYDAMGRVTQRISKKIPESTQGCTLFEPWGASEDCSFEFPLSTDGHTFTVPADTAWFTYDGVGNMIRADNASARIRRSYTPGGLLKTDTSFVRILRYATDGNQIVASDFTSHPYGLTYGYDAAGRLDSLWLPDAIDPCSGACPAQRFTYDANGRLGSIVDVRGETISFAYNNAGERSHVSYPGSVLDSTVYDADGRVLRHRVAISGSPFIADTMTYDPMGRILTQRGRTLLGDAMTTDNAYAGLGALAATAHSAGSTPTTEAFRVDGLGNAYWSEQWHLHLGGGEDEPAIRLRPYNIYGQLVAVTTADSGWQTGETDDHYWYDNEGRTTYHSHWVNDTENTPIQEADYYDGGGHLVQLERHYGWFGNFDNANNPQQVIERYRYDALGRRVLVFALRDSTCVTDGCESTVTRFVWMGQQLLAEIRGPASDATSDNVVESDSPGGNGEFGSPEAYGRVVYTQGPDLDRPFGLIRINGTWTVYAALFPHTNWRDLEATATTESGTLYADRDLVRFAGANASAYLGMNLPPDTAMYWMGSLITEQQDASGLLYRRNRYYDPASGKFTQPDPIGINGGLNTYGFAGGDPINASDPLGLSSCQADDYFCAFARIGWQALGGLIGGAAGFGGGLIAALPCAETCAIATATAGAASLGAAGIVEAGRLFDHIFESSSNDSQRGSGGFDNKRFLNQKGLSGGRRVSVDAEFGGDGEGRVQVTLQGKGLKGGRTDYIINGPDDINQLPRVLRKDQDVLNAISKATDYIH